MALSTSDMSEVSGGKVLSVSKLLFIFVVLKVLCGAGIPCFQRVSVTKVLSGPFTVSRRLSREFKLVGNVRDKEGKNRVYIHGHERTDIEADRDEKGWSI
jgi:hypothetical protein